MIQATLRRRAQTGKCRVLPATKLMLPVLQDNRRSEMSCHFEMSNRLRIPMPSSTPPYSSVGTLVTQYAFSLTAETSFSVIWSIDPDDQL